MTFTVGSTNIEIQSLGRWVGPRQAGTHLLKLVHAVPPNNNVANAFVTVNCAGAPANAFIYANLSIPIVLGAGQRFYLVSVEASPGDPFYNAGPIFTTTGDAVLTGSVYGFLGTQSFFEGSVPNSMYGPVDFKYRVTAAPPTQFLTGTMYPEQDFSSYPNSWGYVRTSTMIDYTGVSVVTGSTTLSIFWRGGGVGGVNWNATIQYFYDNEQLLGTPVSDNGTISTNPIFSKTINTLTSGPGGGPIPDGTHVFYARMLDASGTRAYNVSLSGTAVIVKNAAFKDHHTDQDVWVIPGIQDEHRHSGLPDKIHYSAAAGPCPHNNSYLPYPGPTFVPPATADPRYATALGGDPTLARPNTAYVVDMARGACAEWDGFYRWTKPSVSADGGTPGTGGGVYAFVEDVHRSGLGVDTGTSLEALVCLGFDGTRFDSYLQGGWCTFLDSWDGTFWWALEKGGRLAKLGHDCSVVTVAGWIEDRTKLPYPDTDRGITSLDTFHYALENAGTFVGNIAPRLLPHGMLGAVDLCIDPRTTVSGVDNRDHHIIYVASEIMNCVFKVDLSTSPATISVYAGQSSLTGGFANTTTGPTNARFNAPRSIAMNATTITYSGGSYPPGTLFVADATLNGSGLNGNNLLRAVSPDGNTVYTVCGQLQRPNETETWDPNSLQFYSPSEPIVVNPGTGYNVGDTITLSTGTVIRVNATSGGGVFDPRITYDTFSTVPTTLSNPYAQVSTSGSGHGATFNLPQITIPLSSPKCFFPNVRFIRFDSTGHRLVTIENNSVHIRIVDLAAQTIRYLARFADNVLEMNFSRGDTWLVFDVDTVGTCGPVDDILINNSAIGGLPAQRMNIDGLYQSGSWDASPSGGSTPPLYDFGPRMGIGHYGWGVAFSKHQGRMVTSGTVSSAAHQWRLTSTTEAVNLDYDLTSGLRAVSTVIAGASQGWPLNCRPGFYCLFTRSGVCQTGQPTFDYLHRTYTTSAALHAFFQAGAGGSVHRPELVGHDWEDLEYLVRRFSYDGSYPIPVQRAPQNFHYGLSYPIVTSISALRNDLDHDHGELDGKHADDRHGSGLLGQSNRLWPLGRLHEQLFVNSTEFPRWRRHPYCNDYAPDNEHRTDDFGADDAGLLHGACHGHLWQLRLCELSVDNLMERAFIFAMAFLLLAWRPLVQRGAQPGRQFAARHRHYQRRRLAQILLRHGDFWFGSRLPALGRGAALGLRAKRAPDGARANPWGGSWSKSISVGTCLRLHSTSFGTRGRVMVGNRTTAEIIRDLRGRWAAVPLC